MKYKKHEAKQWARKHLPGIGGGIIQPLKDDYSIDYDGIEPWINRQIEMGVDSIICDGACGEWLTFTVEERKKIHKVAAEIVNNRVPLIANTSHPSIISAVELAQNAQDVGVEDHLVVDEALDVEDRLPAIDLQRLADEHEAVAGSDR